MIVMRRVAGEPLDIFEGNWELVNLETEKIFKVGSRNELEHDMVEAHCKRCQRATKRHNQEQDNA